MSTVPSPYTVSVKPYEAGAFDDYGNPVEGYGTPRDWAVRSIAPGAMDEPGQSLRDLSIVEYSLISDPSDDVPTERDIVTVFGVDYAVHGKPRDWTFGPFVNPVAGIVVELRRVDG
jgi:hypothetical protein